MLALGCEVELSVCLVGEAPDMRQKWVGLAAMSPATSGGRSEPLTQAATGDAGRQV
jgi:hypothetical protein